mmetsp:Transcript_21800/g.25198  ORF Transcript_21800/g.25198 Transcript_21800/m.25198 type:complete len:290 (-) Transcript_21800:1536-2405(-)
MKKTHEVGMKTMLKNLKGGWNGPRCDGEALAKMIAPPTMTVIRTDRIEKMKKQKDIVRGIKKSLKKKKYNGGRQAQHMMAAGFAMTPNISINAAETLFYCAHASVFLQYDIDATGEEVSNSSPSSTTIETALANLAASCLNNRLKQMEGATNLYGTYDKGHRAKVDHFAKILSWWDRAKRKTLYVTLDMDPAGNSSEEVAMAIKHSMDQKEVPKKLSGQTTDNGGGGVLEHLGEKLQELDITNEKFYFIANCTLHNLSLAVSVPVEKVFGLGGIDKNNFMQMQIKCHNQ